ncbi:hypothetical protein F7P69_27630 [Cellulosimicrobium funkei]|nr:hypothetical protein [Cellulosimicrobium funkei]
MSAVAASVAVVGGAGLVMAPAASACTINPTATCESNYEPGTEQEVRDSATCLVTGGAGFLGGPQGALIAYGACQVNNFIG